MTLFDERYHAAGDAEFPRQPLLRPAQFDPCLPYPIPNYDHAGRFPADLSTHPYLANP